MLFNMERARYLSEDYERQVSVKDLQRALRAAQKSRPSAIEEWINQGLYLADWLVRSMEQCGRNVARSTRWMLAAHN
ncbi:MAG: hypothetical protein U0175_16885 [Caldilineaceae bacterium]